MREISRLQQKKFRDQHQRFVVSGLNAVLGALDGQWIDGAMLLLRQDKKDWLKQLPQAAAGHLHFVAEKDFARISDEKTPQGIALILPRPEYPLSAFEPAAGLSLYLEAVNDPGNLGTILRTARWFGVQNILLSPGSADPWQPKVVRASAGYGTRLAIYEQVDAQTLKTVLEQHHLSLLGTVLGAGQAPQKKMGQAPAIVAFGSEAHGLSPQVQEMCSDLITLPKPGTGESLNLAVAVGICLYGLLI